MGHIGLAILANSHSVGGGGAVKGYRGDPPATSTPPLTPDESLPPPDHVVIRKQVDKSINDYNTVDEGMVIAPNGSFMSELTFPPSTPDQLVSQQHPHMHHQQLDPPGSALRYSKEEIDAALLRFNVNQTTSWKGAINRNDVDPEQSNLAHPSISESIVTRVLGIVDLSCVSPFSESKTSDPPVGIGTPSDRYSFLHSRSLEESSVSQGHRTGNNDPVASRISNEEHDKTTATSSQKDTDEVVVRVTPDANQQAHLQLNLPPSPVQSSKQVLRGSPAKRMEAGKIPSKQARSLEQTTSKQAKSSEHKSSWLMKRLTGSSKDSAASSSSSKGPEAQPRQKVEAVLGISPLSSFSEQGRCNDSSFGSPPLAFPKGAESSLLEAFSSNQEEKKEDDMCHDYTEPVAFEQTLSTSGSTSSLHAKKSIPPTSASTVKNITSPVIEPIEYQQTIPSINIAQRKSSTKASKNYSAISFLRKAQATILNSDDPKVLQKPKVGGIKKIRKVFQQRKNKDYDNRTANSSVSVSSPSAGEKTENETTEVVSMASGAMSDNVTTAHALTSSEPTVDGTESRLESVPDGDGENAAAHVRKVLKSIKNSVNEQLETVEEIPDEELSISSTGSDLRVRIPGIHVGAPDAYISGKDLIGDEYIEEFLNYPVHSSKESAEDEIMKSSLNDGQNHEFDEISPIKKVIWDSANGRSDNIGVGNSGSVIIENKTPEREIRDIGVLIQSFNPTTMNRNKSWRDFLNMISPEVPHVKENMNLSNDRSEAEVGKTPLTMEKSSSYNDVVATTVQQNVIRKPMWKAVVDPKSKRTYYYHRKTRETTWTKPPNEDIVPVKPKNPTLVAETPSDVVSMQESLSQKYPRDLDPLVWEKKQEIARVLTDVINPPSSTSVEQLVEKYDGHEEQLLVKLRAMSEAKPFDEPIRNSDKSGAPDDEKQADDEKLLLETAPSGASIALSQGFTSIYSGFSGNLSSSTRKSDTTQPIRNTKSSKPGFATIQENIQPSTSDITSKPDTPVRRLHPLKSSASIPKNIPVPRSRELTVEEFTTRDPVFGVKESDIMERKARGFLNRQRRDNTSASPPVTNSLIAVDTNAYFGDGNGTDHDKDTASYGHTDSVSALSDAEFSFATIQETLERTRRKALNEALAQRDWDRAFDLSETLRTDHCKQSQPSKLNQSFDLAQSPVDRFISENDWDAVATYIARVRARDINAQRQKSDAYLRHQENVVADVIRRSNQHPEAYVRTAYRESHADRRSLAKTPIHRYRQSSEDPRNEKFRRERRYDSRYGKQQTKDETTSQSSFSTNSYSSYSSETTSGSYFTDDEPVRSSSARSGGKEFLA